MATPRWTGAAGDTNWNTVTNWSTGAVPVTNDTVIISATATSSILLNLDRSGDGAGAGLNVVSFEIEPGFQYDIGSATSPLRLTADKFSDYGGGRLYFATDTGTAALPTDRVIIDKSDTTKPVILMGELSGSVSTFTRIEITRGAQVTIGSSLAPVGDVATLYIAPRTSQDEVGVTIGYVNIITDIYLGGGTLVYDGTVAVVSLLMGNGVLDFRSTAIASLTQFGGMVLHNATASNYPITLYNAIGGHMISSNTAGGKLITTLNRGPQWDMTYNPKLSVTTTNYIGG